MFTILARSMMTATRTEPRDDFRWAAPDHWRQAQDHARRTRHADQEKRHD